MSLPTPAHQAAERQFRALLTDADLPLPDETAYFSAAVVFLFHESRAVVLVDLDEFEPAAAAGIDALDGYAQAA